MQEATNVRKYNILSGTMYLGAVILNDSPDGPETIASIIAIKPGVSISEGDWVENTVQLMAFFPSADTDMYILDAMMQKAGIKKEAVKDFHIRRGSVQTGATP